jgi:hypothetical protein
MPAVVAIPQVVEDLLVQFGDMFPNEPARRHFASSMTGLSIVEHKHSAASIASSPPLPTNRVSIAS